MYVARATSDAGISRIFRKRWVLGGKQKNRKRDHTRLLLSSLLKSGISLLTQNFIAPAGINMSHWQCSKTRRILEAKIKGISSRWKTHRFFLQPDERRKGGAERERDREGERERERKPHTHRNVKKRDTERQARWIKKFGWGPDRLEIKRNNGGVFFESPASSPQARFLVPNKNRSRTVAINIPLVRPLGFDRRPRSNPRTPWCIRAHLRRVYHGLSPVLRFLPAYPVEPTARRSVRRSGHPLWFIWFLG